MLDERISSTKKNSFFKESNVNRVCTCVEKLRN